MSGRACARTRALTCRPAPVDCGTLICPWHGLRSAGDWEFGWRTLPAHDDGVLAWVRLDTVRRRRTAGPSGCSGPAHRQRLHAVTRLVGVCEPDGIIANRLDSWHGAGFHPYSFTHLDVLTAPPVDDDLAEDADRFLVAVTFRIGRLRIPVVAEFTSPEPRIIVVRIVDGRRNRQRRRNPRHPGGSRRRQKATHRGIGSGHRSLGPDRLRPSAQGGCAHVFLRMLSCYLSCYLKQALAPILCHDHDEPAAARPGPQSRRCGPAFQPRAGQGLPQAHRRLLPRHSVTSLFADLATICANHVQPAHDMPAFTMITTPTPLQRWAFELLGIARRHGLA